MNHSLLKTFLILIGIYALSFSVTASVLRSSPGTAGVTAPGLRIVRLPATREFSDAVQVPGTDRVLIVEDETHDSVLLLRMAPPGDTDGPVEEVALPGGFYLKDMEGIAMDPAGYVYVVSSHSLNSAGKPRRGSALARMKWSDGRLSNAETLADLRPWLESAVPEIAAVRDLASDSGGLNIEGLAFDPDAGRILLGLRGPLFGRHPALIPIRIIDPAGPFTRANMDMHAPIVLESIDNFGIRSISRDGAARGYWILTGGGGVSAETKNRFHVWFWDGAGTRPLMQDAFKFRKKIGKEKFPLRPEGVCAFRSEAGASFLLIVTDGSPFYFKTINPKPS